MVLALFCHAELVSASPRAHSSRKPCAAFHLRLATIDSSISNFCFSRQNLFHPYPNLSPSRGKGKKGCARVEGEKGGGVKGKGEKRGWTSSRGKGKNPLSPPPFTGDISFLFSLPLDGGGLGWGCLSCHSKGQPHGSWHIWNPQLLRSSQILE